MPDAPVFVPAICPNGHIYPGLPWPIAPGGLVESRGNISRCPAPDCEEWGHIPDGDYAVAFDGAATIRGLSDEDRKLLIEAVARIENAADPDQVFEELEKEQLPGLRHLRAIFDWYCSARGVRAAVATRLFAESLRLVLDPGDEPPPPPPVVVDVDVNLPGETGG